jgi:type II secretory pathway pseudopilin PulG
MRSIQGERGFSYLVLLFAVAIAAAGMAGTGIVWHTALQREKEAELLFIGNQFREAITSYYLRMLARQYPLSLEDLIKDPRFPDTVRHLRKLYRDPITGTTDWGLIAAPGGGIMGIYSKSELAPLKRADFDAQNLELEDRARLLGDKLAYKDWHFVATLAPPARAPLPLKPPPGK